MHRINNASHARHDRTSKALHWLLAILLPATAALGFWLASLGMFDSRLAGAALWHKSLGLLAGLLMLLRLLWRLRQPALPALVSPAAQHLARLVQALLYLLVFSAALSGYMLATGSGRTLEWFGLINLPALVRLDATTLDTLHSLHRLSVLSLIGLSLLHVLAVIKHQWLDKLPLLQRML